MTSKWKGCRFRNQMHFKCKYPNWSRILFPKSTIAKSSMCQLMAVLSFHLPTSYLCFFLSWSTSNVRKSHWLSLQLFLLKYSWYAMLCQYLLCSKVTQFYTYMLFFNILFHYGYSPLCCIVGPCRLSILNVMFASNSSDSQFTPFPPFPLGRHKSHHIPGQSYN